MSDSAVISAPYRQAARRIRARLGHRPAAMIHALRDLAAAQPAPQSVVADRVAPQDDRPSAGEAFSELVRDHLDSPILRFSTRQKLLRQAAQMGLGRFEANLLIALVEHRHRSHPTPQNRPPTRSAWQTAAAVALIEATILAAGWMVFF